MEIWCLFKENVETIIGVSTVVIALCALGFSFWQGFLSRKHNRLSVQPIVSIVTSLLDEPKSLKYALLNNGTGPAIFKSLKLYVNNELKTDISITGWFKVFKEIPYDFSIRNIQLYIPEKGHAILPGDSLPLITIEFTPLFNTKERYFIEAIEDIELEVYFNSIYNEKYIERSTSIKKAFMQ